jgi:CspA family cold shock protein
MATGSIKTIQEERGFGFIAPDDAAGGAELFFHHSAVQDGGFEQLFIGQRVEFEPGTDPRDPSRKRANAVTPIDE